MPHSPLPLPRFRTDPNRTTNYALGETFITPDPKKRPSRPKQLVAASTLGELRPGGSYLFTYNPSSASAAWVTNMENWLARLGSEFTPPVRCYLMPDGVTLFDLTPHTVPRPPLIAPTQRIRSALAPLIAPGLGIKKPVVTVHDRLVAEGKVPDKEPEDD